jgi:hypothetical protein
MTLINCLRLGIAALATLALSSCTTTTPVEFEKNPKGVPKVSLCRTYLESSDPVFQQQIAAELARRGIPYYKCPEMVQQQNQAGAVLAAVVIGGAAIAYCSNHNCGGSGSSYQQPASYPGNCRYSWQTAADGSRCGNRSAASRLGGW